jgi:hypothetical protein
MSPVAVPAFPPDGDHKKENPGVPPEALTVAVPLLPPKQLTLVFPLIVAVMIGGCVIIAVEVVVHPFASEMVAV